MDNFESKVVELQAEMHKIAFYYTKDPNKANDLVQETYVTVFEKRKLYKEDTNIRGWVLTILYHLFINSTRKPKIIHSVENDVLPSFEREGNRLTPDSIIGEKELLKMVSNLSNMQKQTFTMYNIEGFSYKEIAAKLNKPLGTIKANVHFARKNLKDKISKS